MRATVACAAAALCAPALAVDFDGYFRVGPGGTTTSGAARACYGLAGEGLKFRLGNECDLYGEFLRPTRAAVVCDGGEVERGGRQHDRR